MGRLIKEPELRKNEIISVAQALFYQYGYDNTSIKMVIEALQISKGAFYHYFKSKEELLDQLAEKFTAGIVEKLNKILERKDLNAIQKLNEVYLQGSIYKAERFDFILTLIKAIYSEKNLKLRHKFDQKTMFYSLPLMTAIIEQGKNEGLFQVENPEITAHHILLFGTAIGSHNAALLMQLDRNPEKIKEVMQNFKEYQKSVERILGAPKNSISVFDVKFLETLNNYNKK